MIMKNVLIAACEMCFKMLMGIPPIRLNPRAVVVTACLAFMVATPVAAQKTVRYDGVMIMPGDLDQMRQLMSVSVGDRGDGYYDYYENADGDRVKHGKFLFIHKYSASVWQVLYGQYKDGKKTGVWVVKDSIVTKERIKKYALYDVRATYENDLLNGAFKCKRCKSGSFYILECNFVNGRMIGDATFSYVPNVSYEGKASTLQGKMDEAGLPTGVWTMTDKIDVEVIQKRVYVQGACIYVEERNQATGERYSLFGVFPDMKKVSDADNVKVLEESIEYNGQVAKKVKGLNRSPDGWSNRIYQTQANQASIGKYEIGKLLEDVLPSGWRDEEDELGKQMKDWEWHYAVE